MGQVQQQQPQAFMPALQQGLAPQQRPAKGGPQPMAPQQPAKGAPQPQPLPMMNAMQGLMRAMPMTPAPMMAQGAGAPGYHPKPYTMI